MPTPDNTAEIGTGVIRYFHLVIVNVRQVRIETNRIGITDEMDFVTAGGQLQAKFGGDNTAAAVSGITRDADLHFASVPLTGRSTANPI
jgi:hypothetical protein